MAGALVLPATAATRLAGAVTRLPLAALVKLAGLALACTVFAFLAQTWAVRRTSASRASLLMGTETLGAVAVGVGLAVEQPPAIVAGSVLIVVATSYGQHAERRHRLVLPAGGGRPSLLVKTEGGAIDPAAE